MNQILSTSMPINDRKNVKKMRKTIATNSILRFFAISIIIFGIFMVGTGVYAIYKNQVELAEQNLEPTISIENKTETSILLKVMHKKGIVKVQYAWNNDEVTVIDGNNARYVEDVIDIPSGTNVLHVLVQDENGKEITYEKQYETESNIGFEVSGNNIKVTYNGNKNVSYMTYRWDEDEEKTIEINDTSIEYEIEAIKGLHTLTVVVVNDDNSTDTKSQKVNGISKPSLTINYDDEFKHFVIKASDDEQITKIEYRLNYDDEQNYVLDLEEMNLKDVEYTLKNEFQPGENIIEVTVYNNKGVYEQKGAKVMK